ncbi:hypothetical protein AeMF1_012023 [Aphanomyces euteiches]|nr:hypothetical protein AeMF1_012023 [Aphanomyces euteiches]KAH9184605.1 hypothetical protein AeNC1_013416 [Aphanomyces euteiches]
MAASCFFNDCSNDVVPGSWKCSFHKNRSRCLVDDCQNQVYARNLCVRHGGKRRCEAPNCERNVRIGSFCSSHGSGTSKKLCTEPGCSNVAHKRQRCVRHGGGRKCKIDGCKTHARSGGYCCRHTRLVGLVKPSSSLSDETSSSLSSLDLMPWLSVADMKLSGLIDVTVLGEDQDMAEFASFPLPDMLDMDPIVVNDPLADCVDGLFVKTFLDDVSAENDGDNCLLMQF